MMKNFFKNLTLFITGVFIFNTMLIAQEKSAYKIYDSKGKELTYQELLKESQKNDIVLFGELHNNPICHWLQLELVQDLFENIGNNLLLGAEMFEADNQLILNEFLQGFIQEKHLQEEAKLWNNFNTDYRPLLLFAQEKKLTFVASNIPRRYASLVAYQGLGALEKLSPDAQKNIAPLPIPLDLSLSGYAQMIEMMGSHGGSMNPENFASAQAIKDATMGHFILQNYEKGKVFLHFNGTYHSDNFQGIMWYLEEYNKNVKVMTISSVEQNSLENLSEENQNKADFIIVIPSTMTKTY